MDYSNVAVVVIGYDPYKDVWDHCFELMNKYWKDRPATYLVGNELLPDYEGVTVFSAGKDAEWSKKVQVALDNVKEKYVILLLEDFFITREVNNDNLKGLLKVIQNNGVKYCKLLNQSKIRGKRFNGDKQIRIIGEKVQYGVSLQPAIWDREFLKELVGEENYNAWIFEYNQVKNKSHAKEGVICLADKRNLLEITHAIVQSKYLPPAVKTFKKQKYVLNTEARAVLSKKEYFKYRAKQIGDTITPKFMVPFMKKIGRLFKVDFVSDRELKNDK